MGLFPDCCKGLGDIKPLVLTKKDHLPLTAVTGDTVTLQELRRAYYENLQYPALGDSGEARTLIPMVLGAILENPRLFLLLVSPWFLNKRFIAEIVQTRRFSRLYRPHLERTNFFELALQCKQPFCFALLMLEQYDETVSLHILAPQVVFEQDP